MCILIYTKLMLEGLCKLKWFVKILKSLIYFKHTINNRTFSVLDFTDFMTILKFQERQTTIMCNYDLSAFLTPDTNDSSLRHL